MISNSESCAQIFTALAAAQSKFKPVKKTSENPFFSSKYAALDEVIEATKDALSENGICFLQMPTIVDGKFVLITRLGHKSGEWLQFDYPIMTTKQDAQGYGSGVTYARRYSLQSILGIAAESDDDGNAASQPKNDPVKKVISPFKKDDL
jgi:hypothetical protein